MLKMPAATLLISDHFTEIFGSKRGSDRPDAFFHWTSAEGNQWALTLVEEGQVKLTAAATPETYCWLAPLRKLCEHLCNPIHEARIYAADGGLYIVDGEDLLRLRLWASRIASEQLSCGNIPQKDISEVEAFVAVMKKYGEEITDAQERITAAKAEQRGVEVTARDAFVALRDCMREKVPSTGEVKEPGYVEEGQLSGVELTSLLSPSDWAKVARQEAEEHKAAELINGA